MHNEIEIEKDKSVHCPVSKAADKSKIGGYIRNYVYQ